MRISDWSSDVCSSDLVTPGVELETALHRPGAERDRSLGRPAGQVDPLAVAAPRRVGGGAEAGHRQGDVVGPVELDGAVGVGAHEGATVPRRGRTSAMADELTASATTHVEATAEQVFDFIRRPANHAQTRS